MLSMNEKQGLYSSERGIGFTFDNRRCSNYKFIRIRQHWFHTEDVFFESTEANLQSELNDRFMFFLHSVYLPFCPKFGFGFIDFNHLPIMIHFRMK